MRANQLVKPIGYKAQAWFEFRSWIVSTRGVLWRKTTTLTERGELWSTFLDALAKEGRITERQKMSWIRSPGR